MVFPLVRVTAMTCTTVTSIIATWLQHGAHGAGTAEGRGGDILAGIAGDAMIATGSLPIVTAMMILASGTFGAASSPGGSHHHTVAAISFAGRRLLLGSAIPQTLQLIVPGIGHVEGGRPLAATRLAVLAPAQAGGGGLHLVRLRVVLVVLVLLAQIGIAGDLLSLPIPIPIPIPFSITIPIPIPISISISIPFPFAISFPFPFAVSFPLLSLPAILLRWQGYGRLLLSRRRLLALTLSWGLGGRRCVQRCG